MTRPVTKDARNYQRRWRWSYKGNLRQQVRDWHPWYRRLWHWLTGKKNPWRRIKRH